MIFFYILFIVCAHCVCVYTHLRRVLIFIFLKKPHSVSLISLYTDSFVRIVYDTTTKVLKTL